MQMFHSLLAHSDRSISKHKQPRWLMASFAMVLLVAIVGIAQGSNDEIVSLRAAAEQGDAKAQTNLGLMYFDGRGVAKNDKAAVTWYRAAAEQGYADAQHKLGLMYFNGEGVAQSNRAAVEWIERAVFQGHAVAQSDLGAFYHRGIGVPVDYQKAAQLYYLAASQGNGFAQLNLGGLFYNGDGVPKDLSQAAYWFTMASRSGDANAAREGRRWRARLEEVARQRNGIDEDDVLAGFIFFLVALALSGGDGSGAPYPGDSPPTVYNPCSNAIVASASPWCGY